MDQSPDPASNREALPGETVDRAILDYAERALHDEHRTSPFWIWPVSAAAALAICVGLFSQIANFVAPPTVVIMAPGSSAEPGLPPAPAVGADLDPVSSGSLGDPTEQLIEQLRAARSADDPQRFATVLAHAEARGIELSLDRDLRDWAVRHGLASAQP